MVLAQVEELQRFITKGSMGIIYCATNKVNGKIYIGPTIMRG